MLYISLLSNFTIGPTKHYLNSHLRPYNSNLSNVALLYQSIPVKKKEKTGRKNRKRFTSYRINNMIKI